MITAWAVVRRDLQVAWSYRFSFVLQNFGLLFSLVAFRFLADFVDESPPVTLAQYGDDYFSFALIGIVLNTLAFPAVKTFASVVRQAQVTGTFEAMMATRADPVKVVLAMGMYPMMLTLLQVALLVVVAMFLGARFTAAHVAAGALVLALSWAVFLGIGLWSAAFTIVFQQQEPFTSGFLVASMVVSGALYPTAVLPSWLEAIAPLFPATHALEAMRGLFLPDADVGSLTGHLVALSVFALAVPAGAWAVARALDEARRRGALSHY